MATYTTNFPSWSNFEALLAEGDAFEESDTYAQFKARFEALSTVFDSNTGWSYSGGSTARYGTHTSGATAQIYGSNFGTYLATITRMDFSDGTVSASMSMQLQYQASNDSYSGHLYSVTASGNSIMLSMNGDIPWDATSEQWNSWSVTLPLAAGAVTATSSGLVSYSGSDGPVTETINSVSLTDSSGHTASVTGANHTVTYTPPNDPSDVDILHALLAGNDTGTGSSGPDELRGLGGNDALNGLGGNDVLVGGSGDDTLTGGSGNDVFSFDASGNGLDAISDYSSGDVIRIAGAAFASPLSSGNGTATAMKHVEYAQGVGYTTLYIGTDATPGADITITLNGSPAASGLYVWGTDIGFNQAPTGGVAIAGTVMQGRTLVAGNTLGDGDGLGTLTYHWQTSSDGTHWTDRADGRALFVGAADVGARLRVVASYTDGHGSVESLASSATAAVTTGGTAVPTTLRAYAWHSHALLDGVRLDAATATGADGSLVYQTTGSSLTLAPTRQAVGNDSAALGLSDAIDILKMVVGLDINGVGKPLSPYQALAADFDGSGSVNLGDAIGVLRHVVGLDGTAPQWVFANESDLTMAGRANSSPGMVADTLVVSAGATSGLVGILRGDVDGSWTAPQGASYLDSTYFNQLHQQTGIDLAQWGIYSA